jgi:hypothetical protein
LWDFDTQLISHPDRIVVKPESGYNTGVSINKIKSIRKVEKPALAHSNKILQQIEIKLAEFNRSATG